MPDEKPTKAKAKKDDSADEQSAEEETAAPEIVEQKDGDEGAEAVATLTPLEEQLREREKLQQLRRELYRKYHGRPLR